MDGWMGEEDKSRAATYSSKVDSDKAYLKLKQACSGRVIAAEVGYKKNQILVIKCS